MKGIALTTQQRDYLYYIEDNPGCCVSEICRAFGRTSKWLHIATRSSIASLIRQGYLVTMRPTGIGRHRLYLTDKAVSLDDWAE